MRFRCKISLLPLASALLVIIYSLLCLKQQRFEDLPISFACLLISASFIFSDITNKQKQINNKQNEEQDKIELISSRIDKLENHIRNQCINDPVLLPRITDRATENSFHFVFRQKYPGFIPRLRTLVPEITPGEEYLCMMIKLNMSTWEMAKLLGIDIKSIHTSRARLKRKLRLQREAKINDWVNNIQV